MAQHIPPGAPMMMMEPLGQQQQHPIEHQHNIEQFVGAPLDFLLPIEVSLILFLCDSSCF